MAAGRYHVGNPRLAVSPTTSPLTRETTTQAGLKTRLYVIATSLLRRVRPPARSSGGEPAPPSVRHHRLERPQRQRDEHHVEAHEQREPELQDGHVDLGLQERTRAANSRNHDRNDHRI